MKEKIYEIQGKKFTQTELTLGQDKKLIKLWKEMGVSVKELKNIDALGDLVDFLIKNQILEKFLSIILHGEITEVDWDAVTNSTLFEIVNDFLALNGRWIEKLRNFLNNFLNAPSQS